MCSNFTLYVDWAVPVIAGLKLVCNNCGVYVGVFVESCLILNEHTKVKCAN